MYCAACGQAIDDGDRFCARCGRQTALPTSDQLTDQVTPWTSAGVTSADPSSSGGTLGSLPVGQWHSDQPGVPGHWVPTGPHAGSAPTSSGGRGRRWPLVMAGGATAVLLAAATSAYLVGHPDHATATAAAPSSSPHTPPVVAAGTTSAAATPSTAETSFASLYQQDSDGVVRIDTVSCGSQGVGTGFLLSPTLVATVEHVIDQATVISLQLGDQQTTGTVIGSDPSRDLALVQAAQPLTGHEFVLADGAPAVGSRVAAIGYPLGQPLTLTQGGISGLDRTIPIDGTTRSGLIETDTPINPGNSGGPLLDGNGQVVGLVDALDTTANGIGYAVPASQATTAIAGWRASPQVQPTADCADALGPSSQAAAPITAAGPDAGPLAALATYFTSINTGDYAAAYAVLSPAEQGIHNYASFRASTLTTYDMDFHVLGVTDQGNSATVGLTFTSLQSPSQGPDGDSCDDWTLEYRLVQNGGTWRIDQAAALNGSTHRSC